MNKYGWCITAGLETRCIIMSDDRMIGQSDLVTRKKIGILEPGYKDSMSDLAHFEITDTNAVFIFVPC